MAAIPPHPWIPSFRSINNSSGGGVGKGHLSSPARLLAVASGIRLGHLIHLRCTAHLHLLLCPLAPQECYCSDNSDRIRGTWCQRRFWLNRYSLLETLANGFSTSCSSCFSFFNGSEKGHLDKHSSQFKTSERNYSRGRLWTNVILALNVLVYVAQVASQGRLTLWGAKVNSLIDKGQLWRLATSSFLHANIGHLLVNCYSLYSIGPTVEQLSGPRRFIAVYFTSAIASSLMSYRFCQSPAVGASGAIFGLVRLIFKFNEARISFSLLSFLFIDFQVGSLAVFVLRHKSLMGGGKQDLQQIARVIALNMIIGLLSRGIDNWGHLGGLLGGAAMSWFLGPAWKFEFRCDDGRSVFVDRSPIFHFIQRRLR